MVLHADFLPHGGLPQQGYAHDYYSKNGYGHKEDYYSDSGYCENGSSIQMVRPQITTPEPAKHHVVGHGGYGYQDSGYGKHHNYHDHDNYGHGYPSGKYNDDGLYGNTQGFYGQQSHGYPKPPYDMHQSGTSVEYESHQGSYMQKGPSKYESMSYDYYGEGRNRCPTYYEQQHIPSKNWAPKGVEWVSKGI